MMMMMMMIIIIIIIIIGSIPLITPVSDHEKLKS
jgi:hypothetical protein